MTHQLSPQHSDILAELAKGATTTMELIRRCNVICVSARVHELKEMGYPITMQMVTVVNRRGKAVRVAEYALVDNHRAAA